MSESRQPPSGSGSATPGTSSQSAAQHAGDGDVHLLDRLAVVFRYRTVAIAIFVLTTLAVMIQGYTSIQMYEAVAVIQIDNERSTTVPGLTSALDSYFEDPEPYYQTQYKILKSRDLARHAVRRVKLDTVPEFNGTAEPPTTPVTVIRDLRERVVRLIRSAPEIEAPKVDETADESALVNAFLSRVEVEPIRGSHLVNVSFQSTDPKFAAEAVNGLADEYVEQNLLLKQETTQNMLAWLEKELANQQSKVQESERSLAEYRDKQNALSLDDKQNIVVARLNQLNDAVITAKTRRVQRESIYNQVRSVPSGSPVDALPVVAQNASIQSLKGKLADLARQKAQLSERYGDKHPQIQNVNAQLSDTQRELDVETLRALATVKNEYESAMLEEQTLSRALEAAKSDATDLNRKSIDYSVMEREAQSNRQVYEALLQREKELRVENNSRANNVRVADRAEVPKTPITPGGRRTWLMSIFIGLVVSLASVFGLDYMNDTIKTPEDIARRLKLPFLGLIPSVRGDKHPLLASSHVPHDFGESFRALRTSIISKYQHEGTKLMVVTSAQPLEGKTTTAANIAMALAYGGGRVLLIDADMRRPGLHRPLRLTNERGLSQVLVGQARVRDVIQRTVDPNLLAITAGRTPPNPSELLASERMKTLLKNLQHGPFDWIIIDTPPVLAVTDAVILAPHVSGVTFVIGSEMTRRRLAERAVETLLASRPKYMAAVLNKVDFARNRYYYSRYYGHQYKNYYAEAV